MNLGTSSRRKSVRCAQACCLGTTSYRSGSERRRTRSTSTSRFKPASVSSKLARLVRDRLFNFCQSDPSRVDRRNDAQPARRARRSASTALARASHADTLELMSSATTFRGIGSAVFTSLLIAGCASTHNLATDGSNALGGGFTESKIADGIYQIYVRTNWAPWENQTAARNDWRARAERMCGSGKFREVEVRESSYDRIQPMGVLRYIVTTRDGYAVCETVTLSDDQVMALIRNHANK
jgi:hypothetical protein